MFWKQQKNRIYLDYAAATPTRKEVVSVMLPYFSTHFANAGSIHKEGVHVAQTIEKARLRLAQLLHIKPQGVVFTSSGTESNNLALLGIVEKRKKEGVAYADMEVVSTKIEHPSIQQALNKLEALGVGVVYADVTQTGVIDTHTLPLYISPKTVLFCCSYVNSEIGTIEPTTKIARIIREKAKAFNTAIHIHIDAAQAPLWLPCGLDQIGADSIALDAGKCYGPKGVGVLAYIHGVTLEPILFGGGQERGLRPSTLPTPLIVGCVEALCIAQSGYEARANKVALLRDAFISQLLLIPDCVLNGSATDRVANNINISIAGVDAEFAVVSLDEKGVACSTKSACGSGKGDGSTVVRIISNDESRARSTIRFTLGEETKAQELQVTAKLLSDHVTYIRSAFKKFD